MVQFVVPVTDSRRDSEDFADFLLAANVGSFLEITEHTADRA